MLKFMLFIMQLATTERLPIICRARQGICGALILYDMKGYDLYRTGNNFEICPEKIPSKSKFDREF